MSQLQSISGGPEELNEREKTTEGNIEKVNHLSINEQP
jgi:hypothetical protein